MTEHARGKYMSEIQNVSIHVRRQSDAYCRVTFDIPPLNIFGSANIPQLETVVSSLETDVFRPDEWFVSNQGVLQQQQASPPDG